MPPYKRTLANKPYTTRNKTSHGAGGTGLSSLVCTQLPSKATISQAQQTGVKTEFNVKMAIQDHSSLLFWVQWKADEGFNIAI